MRTNSTFGFSTDPDPPLGSVLAHVLHHEKEDEDSFAQPTRAKALRDSIPKTPTAEEEGRGFVAPFSAPISASSAEIDLLYRETHSCVRKATAATEYGTLDAHLSHTRNRRHRVPC